MTSWVAKWFPRWRRQEPLPCPSAWEIERETWGLAGACIRWVITRFHRSPPPMRGPCLTCQPAVRWVEGGEHVGCDFFLRCPRCGRRTVNHVEGSRLTPQIEKLLRKEWRAGRITAPVGSR